MGIRKRDGEGFQDRLESEPLTTAEIRNSEAKRGFVIETERARELSEYNRRVIEGMGAYSGELRGC